MKNTTQKSIDTLLAISPEHAALTLAVILQDDHRAAEGQEVITYLGQNHPDFLAEVLQLLVSKGIVTVQYTEEELAQAQARAEVAA